MSDTTQLAYLIGVLKYSPGVEWDVEDGRGGEKWLWYGKWRSGGPMTVLSQRQVEMMTDDELTGLAIELTFGVGVG